MYQLQVLNYVYNYSLTHVHRSIKSFCRIDDVRHLEVLLTHAVIDTWIDVQIDDNHLLFPR